MAKAAKPKVAKRAAAKKVAVRTPSLAGAAYDVLIGEGLLPGGADGLAVPGIGVLVLIDNNLPRDLVEPVLRTLDRARARWGVTVVTATEADKSLLTFERALVEAARLRVERFGIVLALGGGIVCDIAGFVAASFKRGVRVIQCPTTLLAMVDAAVGGKTGLNLTVTGGDGKPRLLKNMVGAFHQPSRVVCDVASLRSLPLRELRCGLAECVKHGLLGGAQKDARLLDWTEASMGKILALNVPTLVELINRNVAIKARVVAKDPHETSASKDGGRMMLNLGHTFAHVLETLPGLSWRHGDGSIQIGPLKHGEAVGLGLLCACRAAAGLKLVKADLGDRIAALLSRIGLPTRIDGLPETTAIIERMIDDKKTAGGKVRLILPCKGLACKVVDNAPPKVVVAAVESLRS